MADDKKNITETGKVDEPPSRERESLPKLLPPMQDQPAPVNAEAPAEAHTAKEGNIPGARSSPKR